jgi:3-hydroxymyristoyl/3-hydroxydecanoyl-(acyl carrier protein) dehydratase
MSADASHALCVDDAHPSLPGHFPGSPVVPGVVLLSEVLAEQRRQLPQVRVTGIKKLKFLRMLFPNQEFTVEFGATAANNLRFKCWQGGTLLAEGNFVLKPVVAQFMPPGDQMLA